MDAAIVSAQAQGTGQIGEIVVEGKKRVKKPTQRQQAAQPVELPRQEPQAQEERGDGPVQGYVSQKSLTGTKTNTPLTKTPQAISVVPRQQIEDQAAKTVAEALRYTAGVFTEYRGSSNLHDEMFIRGFNYVPRYLNGLLYGSGSFGQMDPYFLERVEVIKGPASVLYGQANPGGIVNLVSKLPTGETHREVFVEFGTENRFATGFDVGGVVSPEISYRVVGVGLDSDGEVNYTEKKRVGVMPSVMWKPTENTKLVVDGMYTYEPNAGFRNFLEAKGTMYPTSYGYVPHDFYMGEPGYDKYERTQYYIGYQFEHRFDPTFTVRQSARLSRIKTMFNTMVEWGVVDDNTFSRKAGAGPEELTQFTVDNQVQADFKTAFVKHKVLGGVDYRWSRRDYQWGYAATLSYIDWNNPVYGQPIDTAIINNTDNKTITDQVGLYLQDQIEIGRLNLLAGVRHDWASNEVTDYLKSGAKTSQDDTATTWRAGAIYNFANGISPYVSFSQSFEPVTQAPASGQAPFKPTTGEQYEAGVKYAPPGTRMLFTAAVFDLTKQNVLTRQKSTDPYMQIGEIRSRGLELEAHAELTENISAVASYSHIDMEVTDNLDSTVLGKMPARVPIDQVSLWGKYDFKDGAFNGLGLGAGVRFIGESWGNDTNTFKVPAVALFDASVSYDLSASFPNLKGTKLQVNATNISDEQYVASCASAGACFYGSGRAVTGQVKYSW
jgi:iron complex outermembrane recepter protein